MRCSGLIKSAVVALSIVAGGGSAIDAAWAAHKPTHWTTWSGTWWRQGPWADHTVHGLVFGRPRPTAVYVPWGAEWLRYCAARYRSFDPVSGTYLTRRGKRRACH